MHKAGRESGGVWWGVPFKTKKNFFGERNVSLVGLVNLMSPVSWRAGLLSLVYTRTTESSVSAPIHTTPKYAYGSSFDLTKLDLKNKKKKKR